MSNLAELNPIDVLGDDDEPLVDFQATDPTSWDGNNLLGRYHVWKIASKFPIPGSAVLNDYKRRQLGPTADELEVQTSKIRKEFEAREEVMRCVLVELRAAQQTPGPLWKWRGLLLARSDVHTKMAMNPIIKSDYAALLDKADAVITAAETELAVVTRLVFHDYFSRGSGLSGDLSRVVTALD